MSRHEPTLDELELRIIRLEAAHREAVERRNRLRRASAAPLFLTPEQHAARTRLTGHLDTRPRS